MKHESTRATALDYQSCHYGGSALRFRGPRRKTEGDYIAVLGGTETYGKFIPKPWPDQLEERIGLPVANLALPNSGLDVYLGDDAVRRICAGARATIIEIGGVLNLCNDYYLVHPRRNDRLLRATPRLEALFPELDFISYNFTRHLLRDIEDLDAERRSQFLNALKASWLGRMRQLIRAIGGPVILLWLGDHAPDRWPDAPRPETRRRGAGHLVDETMLAALRLLVTGLVRIVADAEELQQGFCKMVFSELEAQAAAEMLGPVVHRRAAVQVGEWLNR